jgi:phosphatidate phosphatase APP1
VYGELARRHPEQIERILIRDVTGETAEAERHQAAFRDVPRTRWHIFTDPTGIGVR